MLVDILRVDNIDSEQDIVDSDKEEPDLENTCSSGEDSDN